MMDLSEDIKNEIELIKERIDNDEKPVFEVFLNNCKNTQDVKTLLIRYRHFLNDKYDVDWNCRVDDEMKRPILIGYLMNTDKIFYNEIDHVICNYLRNEGAKVIQFGYEDFAFKASSNGIEIYINDQNIQFDGFLSYGYRRKENLDVYLYMVKMMEQKGTVCLHTYEIDKILNSKLLQAMYFAAAKVPIPDTYQTFDIESTKKLVERVPDIAPTIIKSHDDYGGAGVVKVDHKNGAVNLVAKSLWKGENVLMQKFIPDSIGHSIRVLCFNGKAFTITEYEDLTGNFKSNVNYGEKFRLNPLTDSPKFNLYKEVAEKAINSIGNIMLAGVDLLDSPSEGVVVLEINGWPDIFDSWYVTSKCGFKMLAESLISRIKESFRNRQKKSS